MKSRREREGAREREREREEEREKERDRFGALRRATKSSPTVLSRWPSQLGVAIHFIKLRFKGRKRRRASYRTRGKHLKRHYGTAGRTHSMIVYWHFASTLPSTMLLAGVNATDARVHATIRMVRHFATSSLLFLFVFPQTGITV